MGEKRIEALIDSANKLFEAGNFDHALQSYRNILATYPKLTPDIQVSLISKIVMCLYKTEQYSRAPQELEGFGKLFEVGSIVTTEIKIPKITD